MSNPYISLWNNQASINNGWWAIVLRGEIGDDVHFEIRSNLHEAYEKMQRFCDEQGYANYHVESNLLKELNRQTAKITETF